MATLVECGICLEDFRTPKILPCSHTFCLRCLQRHTKQLQRGLFYCPTCRTEVPIPSRGVQGFPDNQHAEQLIALKKAARRRSDDNEQLEDDKETAAARAQILEGQVRFCLFTLGARRPLAIFPPL